MMRKLLLSITMALALSGCASLQTAWSVITSAAVTPQQIIIAGNTFDGLEATATQYLVYCKANVGTPQCALSIRQKVVADVRAGRVARNALEPYVTSGTAGPAAIYNTLVASITSLQASSATVQGAAK
jgi:uncharacterized protein YceK